MIKQFFAVATLIFLAVAIFPLLIFVGTSIIAFGLGLVALLIFFILPAALAIGAFIIGLLLFFELAD